MGYSEDPAMVRVDFFKPSGKWYTTEAVKWTGEWKGSIENGGELMHDAFAKSLRDHFKNTGGGYINRLSEMDAVCLHPYHEHEHPICLRKGGWLE